MSCAARAACLLLAALVACSATTLPVPSTTTLPAPSTTTLPTPSTTTLPAPSTTTLPAPAGAPLLCQHALCTYVGGSDTNHHYTVEGHNIFIDYLANSQINVMCKGSNVLESPAMPRADYFLRVEQVTLMDCPLPAATSLRDTLAALNVTLVYGQTRASRFPVGGLMLVGIPHAPPLTELHFRGLENLTILGLVARPEKHVKPESGFLKLLKNLEMLLVRDVTLPANALDEPLPALRKLELINAGVERLSEALVSSTSLREVTIISESAFNAVAVPPGLRRLTIRSPATTLRLDAAPALRTLSLSNWMETMPTPLTLCGNLTTIFLTSPAVQKLPDSWLANCLYFESLQIQNAKNLTSLLPNLLNNTSTLKYLTINRCPLNTLPMGFLDHSSELRKLDLSKNYLQTLPSGIFAKTQNLEMIDLSENDLDGTAIKELNMLKKLISLILDKNPKISNICDRTRKSPMKESTQLKTLSLRETSVNYICPDWRLDMTLLSTLDLRSTRVSELSFEDLQFERNGKRAVVRFYDLPITLIGLTREQYNEAIKKPQNGAVLVIDNLLELKCDCHMYWTRRALDASALDYVPEIYCVGGSALNSIPPEEMLCTGNQTDVRQITPEGTEAALPKGCTWSWRPDDNSDHDQQLVRVNCEGSGLDYVPILSASKNRIYELLLAYNLITNLPAEILRSDIKRLDLSFNSIEAVQKKTVENIGSFDGVLQLAANPLNCSCSAAPLLRALSHQPDALTDLDTVTCADGTKLKNAPISEGVCGRTDSILG